MKIAAIRWRSGPGTKTWRISQLSMAKRLETVGGRNYLFCVGFEVDGDDTEKEGGCVSGRAFAWYSLGKNDSMSERAIVRAASALDQAFMGSEVSGIMCSMLTVRVTCWNLELTLRFVGTVQYLQRVIYKESVQIKHIYNGQDLFPEPTIGHQTSPTTPLKAIEEVLIKIAGAILNLIDKHYSVEVENGDDADNGKRMTVRSLAETISSRMNIPGDLTVVRLRQGNDVVAILARAADEIQWPLVKDEAAVKLDHSRGVMVLWVDLAF
ncbi:senescence/dehydration-associated protein [Quercus suber]|uniref:Senescence/dehydration-associated protein n=1 Tax=Quercus suber TaxID=58331 RepID=A0AAW0LW35_QUESU